MLALDHIETAIKRYCILDKKKKRSGESERDYFLRMSSMHPLATDEDAECFRVLGLMIFVGVARMYAFDKKSIISYLLIEHHQYKECLYLYQKYMAQALKLHTVDPQSKAGRVFYRTQDVVGYINRKCA